MRKRRSSRFLAAILAASVMMSQGGFVSYAEEGVESAPAMETSVEPETPAPEPETPAPTPEPETSAPETSAPEPETPAPAPEPETPTPESASVPVTEMPTEIATQAATEGMTQAGTEGLIQDPELFTESSTSLAPEVQAEGQTDGSEEKSSEDETEEQTEEAKETTKLSADISGGTITVTLSENDAVSDQAKLRVTTAKGSAYDTYAGAVKNVTDKGHRRMAGAQFYELSLEDDGNSVYPVDPVTVEISYSSHLALGLEPYHLEEAGLYTNFAAPAALGSASVALDSDLRAAAASYQGEWLDELAVVAVCDHINDGAPVTAGQLRGYISAVSTDYAAAARVSTGASDVPEQVVTVDALNAGTQKAAPAYAGEENPREHLPAASAVSAGLGGIAAASLQLANAKSSGDVLVVNVYADEAGNIDWTPLTPALNGEALDVSGHMVLINIAAYSAGQGLSVPVFGVKDAATAGAAYSADDATVRKAGRVIYNFVAQGEEKTPYAFEGSVNMGGSAFGAYLAASALVNISGGLTGSAYADTLVVSDGTPITQALVGQDRVAGDTQPESEPATEETSERPDTMLVGINAEEADEDAKDLGDDPVASVTLDVTVKKADGSPVSGATLTAQTTEETPRALSIEYAEDETNKGLYHLTVNIGPAGEALYDLLHPEAPEEAGKPVNILVTVQAEGYKEKSVENVAVTLTKGTDPETGDPTETYSISPEEADVTLEAKRALIIPVSAVNEQNADLADAHITLDLQSGATQTKLGELNTATDSAANVVTLYLDDLAAELPAVADFLSEFGKKNPADKMLTISLTETKVPLYYNFPAEKTKGITISTSDYYTGVPEDDIVWNDAFTAERVSFVHPLATLSLTPLAVVAGTETTIADAAYQDEAGTAIAGGATQQYTLRDNALFADLADEAKRDAGVSFTVDETTVPAAYICTEKQKTVKAVVDPDTNVITWEREGNKSTALTLKYPHLEKLLTVTMQAINRDTHAGLPATFMFKDANGAWIADADGRTSVPSTDGSAVKATFKGDVKKITVVQTGVPSNYLIAGSAEMTFESFSYDPAKGTAELTATFQNYYVQTTTESITVRKEWYVGEDKRFYNASGDTTFYLALFSDEAKTNRVSPIYPVTAKAGNPYKTRTIGHLSAGTYYVAETDANGVPVTSTGDIAYVTYEADPTGKVVIRGSGSTVHNVTVKNHYNTLPDGGQHLGMVGIRKQVLKADGTLDTSYDGTVTIQIRYKSGSKTLSQKKQVAVSKGKSNYYVFYVPLGTGSSRDVTVYEAYTSGNKTYYAKSGGKVSLGGKTYTMTVSTPTVKIASQQSSVPLVTVSNTGEAEQSKDQEGSKKDGSTTGDASQAVLKLTKRVTYKGQPVRVNSGYYIGIFDDANLSKLRYKKAMAFKNASEVTASLKINLYKLSSKQVTFYFAEVDKDGRPVQSGTAFGYNVSQNKQSITLNEKNLEDEVIFTNDVVTGSRREQALTTPSSGFAGDAYVAADAAAMASSEDTRQAGNSSRDTKTGDDTPIALYVGLLAAALVLIIAGIIIIRRKKKH